MITELYYLDIVDNMYVLQIRYVQTQQICTIKRTIAIYTVQVVRATTLYL